jgi:muconolactone delta-isomerase
MKVLAIGQIPDGVDRADFARYQQAELRRAWQLYSDGVIRELYTRTDAPNVVLMLEAPDLERARAAIDSLPMVPAGVLTFNLMALGPFLHFQHLFAPETAGASAALVGS